MCIREDGLVNKLKKKKTKVENINLFSFVLRKMHESCEGMQCCIGISMYLSGSLSIPCKRSRLDPSLRIVCSLCLLTAVTASLLGLLFTIPFSCGQSTRITT